MAFFVARDWHGPFLFPSLSWFDAASDLSWTNASPTCAMAKTRSSSGSSTAGSVRPNWLEPETGVPEPPAMHNPFRYFNSSPEVIRLTAMMYIRYPLSLRQVEDLLAERGVDICHETVRFCWNRSVRCSPRKSASGTCIIPHSPNGAGIWARSS